MITYKVKFQGNEEVIIHRSINTNQIGEMTSTSPDLLKLVAGTYGDGRVCGNEPFPRDIAVALFDLQQSKQLTFSIEDPLGVLEQKDTPLPPGTVS
ncbi:MAG: hypothetical protein ACRC78_02720 [Planktothrix sp.]